MSTPPRLHNSSFRYFRAKLLSLGSPTVWVPALILTLIGAFGLEYVTTPTAMDEQPTEGSQLSPTSLRDTLTPEQLRQAAEIDNIAVLSELVDETTANPTPPVTTAPVEPATQTTSAGDRFLAERQAQAQSAATARSPLTPLDFLTQSEANRSLELPDSLTNAAASPTSATGTADPIGTSRSTVAGPSSLDQALGRSTTSTAPNPATTTAPSNPTTNASPTTLLPQPVAQPLPTSFIRTAPNMSPPPGTTGYTPPSTLNLMPLAPSSGNAYNNLVSSPSRDLTSPGVTGVNRTPNTTINPSSFSGSSGFVPAPSQPLSPIAPAPFSVPRRSPGQYIGNGEFNTFSNP